MNELYDSGRYYPLPQATKSNPCPVCLFLLRGRSSRHSSESLRESLGCALGALGSTGALDNLNKAHQVQVRFHASEHDIENSKLNKKQITCKDVKCYNMIHQLIRYRLG